LFYETKGQEDTMHNTISEIPNTQLAKTCLLGILRGHSDGSVSKV